LSVPKQRTRARSLFLSKLLAAWSDKGLCTIRSRGRAFPWLPKRLQRRLCWAVKAPRSPVKAPRQFSLRLGLTGVTSWKVSEDRSTGPVLPTRAKAACICCRSPRAGDTLGNPDVCPKFACPGDSGAMGKPDVSPSPLFVGVIALITIRPLRNTCPAASASLPGCCSPSCAMIPTTLMSPSIRQLPSLPC
jgi:hypothetical protein